MKNPAQLFPLTDEQLAEWRSRIHEKYMLAEMALQDARYHDRLYRRYSKRHIAAMNLRAKEELQEASRAKV